VAGLAAIKAKGGVAIVQDPIDALFADLPRNALKAGVADYTVAAKDIAGLLVQLADRDVEEQGMDPDGRLELENQIAMGSRFAISVDPEELGAADRLHLSGLQQRIDGRWREHLPLPVNQAWTTEALLLARDDELEETVWGAMRIACSR